MRKSKRFSALAIAASLALVAAACGSDDDGGSSTEAPAETSAQTSPPASEPASTEAPTSEPADTEGSTEPAGPTGCTAGEPVAPEVETLEADGAGHTVGLMFDVTGRGDKSFNDGAAAGLDKAKADFGVEGVESEPAA